MEQNHSISMITHTMNTMRRPRIYEDYEWIIQCEGGQQVIRRAI